MIKNINYKTSGVCSKQINISIDTDTDTVVEVKFVGGCPGNTQGVASLATGMTVDSILEKVTGIKCGFKPTSCPDQLAQALLQYKAEK